jgi:hypothetical protein
VAVTTSAQVSVLPTKVEATTTTAAAATSPEETEVAVAGVKAGGGLAPTGATRSQGPALALSLGLLVAGAALLALSAGRTYRRRH